MVRIVAFWLAGLVASFRASAGDPWEQALQRMPLELATRELNRTNCVALMLGAFQQDSIVKALIFMPGATDELYMFHRAKAVLTNGSPTLLDAVIALTNQTFIRATFRSPLLLLHSDEDPLEPLVQVENQKALERLKRAGSLRRLVANDRDWDFVQPILRKTVKVDVRPWRYSSDSWHFYRHSLSAWNLTSWEAVEAVALAGKTKLTIRRKGIFSFPRTEVVFEPDARVRQVPKLDSFPH